MFKTAKKIMRRAMALQNLYELTFIALNCIKFFDKMTEGKAGRLKE